VLFETRADKESMMRISTLVIAAAMLGAMLAACTSPSPTPVRPLSIPGQPPPPPVNPYTDGNLASVEAMDVFRYEYGQAEPTITEYDIKDAAGIQQLLKMLDVSQTMHEPTRCLDLYVLRLHFPGDQVTKYNIACAPPGEAVMLRGMNEVLRGGEVFLPEGFVDALEDLVESSSSDGE